MRPNIIAATAVVTLFSTSVLSQQPNRGTGTIPDFSGIWSHPYFPGFEPPAAGPGPVTNRKRRNGISDPYQLVGDYTNPILKPVAAEAVKQHGELELNGTNAPTPGNECWPSGVPYIFFQFGMQMLQQPDKITLLYLRNYEFRHVRLNQLHPTQVTPSWYGDSVGHYEGDTLVIDTVGIKTGPHTMVDMYGTPHGAALHVIERYRLIDYAEAKPAMERNEKENMRFRTENSTLEVDPNYRGKHLQLEFTVDDPEVFMTPWSATITYGRPLGFWDEYVCAENRFGLYTTGRETKVPTADNRDF
jgi:hypothetical protein